MPCLHEKDQPTAFTPGGQTGRARATVFTSCCCVLALLGTGGCRPASPPPQPPPATPAPAPGPPPAPPTAYVQVASQDEHTCVLRQGGDVLCWGKNTYGQLGNGRREERGDVSAVAALNDAVAVAVGRDFSCALRRQGNVVCWGNNEDGQLGDGRGARPGALSLRPVVVAGLRDVQELVAGEYHACARDRGGRVKCWGNASNGQIGSDAQRAFAMPLTIERLGTVRQLASGANHVCALEDSGAVKCWGRNTEGQLGDGRSGSKVHAVAVENLRDATAIWAGHNHSCAVRAEGSVSCWGDNAMTQLGPRAGREPRHRTPVVVTGLSNVAQLVGGVSHTCARLQSGRVTCWGGNAQGQLGHTSAAQSRSTPTAVRGVDDAIDLASGARHVCAIRRRGDLVCWGSDARTLGEPSARPPVVASW